MGTLPADDPTVLSAIPEAEIEEELSAAWSTSPAKLWEDSVALTTILADQLTDPPTPASSMGNEGKEYPEWKKVHSFHKVATVGSIPYNPGESQQCCNHSSGWQKRAHCLLEEEWQDLWDVSGSVPSEGSPEPMPPEQRR